MGHPDETEPELPGNRGGPRPTRQLRLALVIECDRPTAGGADWPIDSLDEIAIGRGTQREGHLEGRRLRIQVPASALSSTHCRLVPRGGALHLEDLGSRNGTRVEGEVVTSRVVRPGEVFEAGRCFFVVTERVQVEPASPSRDFATSGSAAGFTFVPGIEEVWSVVDRIAPTRMAVLITGETGVGKEVLARALHARSERRGALVPVNCGAIPAGLVEAQLFGHVRGAFSGASTDGVGLVRAANGGTLFLDEIGDLPRPAQAALLRVLQEGEVLPVGAHKPIRVDLRVVAATHHDLERAVARDTFRADLFARLRGAQIAMPPLRDRRPDLGSLIAALLPAGAREVRVDPTAFRRLLAYEWPHNVRELQQWLGHAVLHGNIGVEQLPKRASTAPTAPPTDDRLEETLRGELEKHGGNVAAVARAMGKAPAQIHRWMKKFGVDPAGYRG